LEASAVPEEEKQEVEAEKQAEEKEVQ